MLMKLKPLVLCLVLTACGRPDTPATNVASPSIDNTTVAQLEAPPIPLGKTAVASGVEVKVIAVTQRDRIGRSFRTGPGEGFVVVRYDVKNLTTEPMSRVERPAITLRDQEGRSYSDDGAAGLSLTEGGIADATTDTNPNMTARVTSVWKVDKASFDAAGWTLVLATDPQLQFALK